MNWGSSALTRTAIDGGAHCGGAGAGVGAADVHEHVLVLHVTGSGCWFGRGLPCMLSICCRSRCRSTASQSALEGVRRQRLPLASSGLNPLQNNPIQHNNNASRKEWAWHQASAAAGASSTGHCSVKRLRRINQSAARSTQVWQRARATRASLRDRLAVGETDRGDGGLQGRLGCANGCKHKSEDDTSEKSSAGHAECTNHLRLFW